MLVTVPLTSCMSNEMIKCEFDYNSGYDEVRYIEIKCYF